jgi:hypothetical protein
MARNEVIGAVTTPNKTVALPYVAARPSAKLWKREGRP